MAIEDLKESLGIDDEDFAPFKSGVNELERSTSKFRKGIKGQGSVVKAAKGNIFEFPVFISSSVPLDYATATSSLLEQVYASYLQMAISINPVIDNRTAVNGNQFSRFKSNTNKYLECVDTMYQQDACHNLIRNDDDVYVEFNLMSVDDSEARFINEAVDYQPLSEFDHFFQEANKPTKRPNGQYGVNNNDDYTTPQRTKNNKTYSSGEMSFADAEHLYYQIESLKKQVDEMDAEQKAKATASGLGSARNYDYREAKAKLEKLEAEAKKLKDEASDTALEHERTMRKLNEDVARSKDALQKEQKRASKASDKRAEAKHKKELKKLKADAELAKKKLDDYEADHQRAIDKHDADIKKINEDLKRAADEYNLKLKKDTREAEEHEWKRSDRKASQMSAANQGRIRAPQFMDETKIQKLNTMKPLMMTVDMNVESKDGGMHGVQYIVGVKTHNRLVDADTLPEVVEYPLKEMNKLTRKAKWRAGELKFFKDILFKIKQKKQTAIDSRDPKRKWYRRLYELAHMKGDAPAAAVISGDSVIKAFFKDKLGRYGDSYGVIPNATLVISKADVDIIKRETKIDMLKGSTASKFCKELFMIGIVVIDNDAESIKILLPDLHNDYEVHSIASVNKQLAMLDTSGSKTRDMFKLLG